MRAADFGDCYMGGRDAQCDYVRYGGGGGDGGGVLCIVQEQQNLMYCNFCSNTCSRSPCTPASPSLHYQQRRTCIISTVICIPLFYCDAYCTEEFYQIVLWGFMKSTRAFQNQHCRLLFSVSECTKASCDSQSNIMSAMLREASGLYAELLWLDKPRNPLKLKPICRSDSIITAAPTICLIF